MYGIAGVLIRRRRPARQQRPLHSQPTEHPIGQNCAPWCSLVRFDQLWLSAPVVPQGHQAVGGDIPNRQLLSRQQVLQVVAHAVLVVMQEVCHGLERFWLRHTRMAW